MDKEKKDKKSFLGELLIGQKIITSQQLEVALEEQKRTGELIAQIIVNKNWADEEKIYRILFKGIHHSQGIL